MKKQSIQIFVHENGGDLLASLSSIEENGKDIDISLCCVFRNKEIKEELIDKCKCLCDKEIIKAFEVLYARPEVSFEQNVNQFFQGNKQAGHKNSFIFLLSSTVLLAPFTIASLVNRLSREDATAGLNPLLLAAWTNAGYNRVAHMGTVCDCQQYLHYLYEGLPAANPLVQKTRFFQIAHPGSLLIRHEDFSNIGGFNTEIDYLAWYAFFLNLTRIRKNGFSTEPSGQAYLTNRFDSWEFCGIWNSAMQRGRLKADGINIDYPFKVEADGLEYKLDDWLCEHAHPLPLELQPESPEEKWLAWRHTPNPLSLVKHISSLPVSERSLAFDLATTLPASMPKVFGYYKAQCAKIKSAAKEFQLASLERQCTQWTKKSARFHHGLLKPGIRLLQKAGFYNCSLGQSPSPFDAWAEIRENFADMRIGEEWPQIAVVMPVWNPNPQFLVEAIDSVRSQKYANWQLCIADDASTNPAIAEILRSCAASEKRISLKFRERNGHICRASNSALELVQAPYAAFLDHDDMLAPEALALVAEKISANPGLGYLYSDDDRIDVNNVRRSPVFKPDFDCDLFYVGHLSTYATSIAREAGCLRPGLEGSQDRDLQMRVTEMLQPDQIAHIPRILYHWRVHENSTAGSLAAKPYILEASKRAWLDAALRRGRKAEIVETGKNNFFILAYELPGEVACSVIMLTDAKAPGPTKELRLCLEHLAKKIRLEIFIQPLHCGTYPSAFAQIAGLPIHMLPHAENGWPDACNAAAGRAEFPIVLFLYAGLRPLPQCRPEQLIAEAARQDIAMTGGLIWHDGFLVNGGWYPDITGMPFPLLRGIPKSQLSSSAWGQFLLPRHTLGVSWQCMATKKEILEKGNFLDESMGELALVDFSLRQMASSWHTLASPWGQWEYGKKEPRPSWNEMEKLQDRWGDAIRHNGLRNPNLRAAPDNDWTLVL